MASKINGLLTQFLEYLEIEKNRSQLTVRNYDFYLKRFLAFARIGNPGQIDLEKVRQFRLYLNRLVTGGKPLKKSTQNYHIIAIRSFLKFLAKRDIKTLAPEKLELAKVGERSVEFLEGADLDRLLEVPLKSRAPEIIKLRDKAILELLFSAGLRVSELANLKIDSVNLKRDEFTVRGKGDKPRVVFISNQAKYAIKQYLAARRDTENWLFVGHDRGAKSRNQENKKSNHPLTPRSIQRLVERYSVMAGITKHVTPHTLRHSYATDLLMNGADIRSVQAMLGHASITTTQIYTHITNQQLRDVHKAFHGRKRK
ncbi:MAG: tyrosine-type recombinase/integrase [Candidatus Komeilibacteria bacterium]|nr:tyrosine-type recombinase/integrase [Candidatus Komeilibacteria bacterium]